MKSLLIPIILFAVGTSAGVGAGLFLKPEAEEEEVADASSAESGEEGKPVPEAEEQSEEVEEQDASREYVKLNNQFIVPVVEEGRVVSMVVLSLTVEAMPGGREAIYGREPKLRDSFLRDLFEHANAGGFSGNFTSEVKLKSLSGALRKTAKEMMGDIVTDVFITDIVRQDS